MLLEEKQSRAEARKQEKYNREHKIINGAIYKWCKKGQHWEVMDTEHFYINKSNGIDGFHPDCKYHCIEDTKQWRRDNPEWYKELNHKTNTNPSDKTRETYRVNSQTRRDNGKYYEWLDDNPDKQAKYIENHRIHDITETEWRHCLNVFNSTCAYCGLPIGQHIVQRKGKYFIMDLHREHVDDKGYNDLRNCVPACRDCNSAKHDFIMIDWYSKQKFFTKERYDKIIWWTEEGYKDYIGDKPPYSIFRKQNEGKRTFHWELWSIDEKRNIVNLIDSKDKKKQLNINFVSNQNHDTM